MVSKTIDKPLSTPDLMDGMRAIAAIVVLFSHERNVLFTDASPDLPWLWKGFYFVTGFGHQAVMIFFVLSGYWIAKSVARQHAQNRFDWIGYAIDRISRLWIVLLPALILGGALDFVGRYALMAPIYRGVQGTSVLTQDVATHLSFVCFLGNLGFVQTLLVAQFGTNGSLWSLASEFWYYVWFPALYPLLRGRAGSVVMLAAALGSMALFRTLLPGFLCWLFGALLFFAAAQLPAKATASRAGGLAAACAGFAFAAILVSTKAPGLWSNETLADVCISGSFAVMLYALMRCCATYSRWLAPLCRFGAGSSYSLYAIHLPLAVMLAALFWTPARRIPPSATPLIAFALVTLVTLGCAYLYSRCTEAHTASLRGWLKRQYLQRVRIAA